MEGIFEAAEAVFFFQLRNEALFVYADAHGRDLEGAVEHGIIEDDVAVERPVVIVGRPAVVLFARAQLAADLHDEGGAVLADVRRFALFGGEVGIHILQLLGGDKADLVAEVVIQRGVFGADGVRRRLQGGVDLFHRRLQKFDRPVVAADDRFPIPLIDVNGMQIVEVFVAADGVHVGIEAEAHPEAVLCQGVALPLRQRMDDLGNFARRLYVERDGALDAVQVVVEAAFAGDEQRRADARQVERFRKLFFKDGLDLFQCPLRLDERQLRGVHNSTSPVSFAAFAARTAAQSSRARRKSCARKYRSPRTSFEIPVRAARQIRPRCASPPPLRQTMPWGYLRTRRIPQATRPAFGRCARIRRGKICFCPPHRRW